MPTKIKSCVSRVAKPRIVKESVPILSRNQQRLYRAIELADAVPVRLHAKQDFDVTQIIAANREEDRENLGH